MTIRSSSRISAAIVFGLFALLGTLIARSAPIVQVTLQVDKSVLKVGDSTTAHVMAQIVPDQLTNTLQIVSWYVDLLNSSSSAIQIDPTTVVVPVADSDPSTSSKGTFTSGNLRAIYDTFLNTPGAGHDAPVELFSVKIKAAAVGATTLSVAAGTTAPALDQDFIVASSTGDALFGGAYDTATAQLSSFNNVPPTIDPIQNITVAEGTKMTVTAVGHDSDVGQTLRYALAGLQPGGAILDPVTGVLTWTPSEQQGPTVYAFKIKVTDNGTPAMSATNNFNITVTEVNTAPSLQVPSTINVNELQPISATCVATDTDFLFGINPSTNRLTFSLQNPPVGASINPTNGLFAWTPTEAQGPTNCTIKVVVTDDGSPPMAATNSFTINVAEVNARPTIISPGNQTVAEGATLNVAFVANDIDLPANQLTFKLVSGPPGVVLDTSSGLVSWTPTEAQGPGVYSVQVAVTDNATVPLSATNIMQVTVTEVNATPTLDFLPDRTVTELTPLTFTATAHDTDLPAQTLTFSLISPPAGASINATNGAFSWTPTEAQGPGRYTITVRATDSGSPAAADTKSFDVVVNEQNLPPTLVTPPGKATQTVPELSPVSIQFTATDTDLPANLISFSLRNAPVGATIDAASGLFSWTPTEAQGPGTYVINVVATDNGTPSLSATNTINLTVTEVSTPPTVSPIQDQIVNELAKLTVPVIATDSDVPAQTLTYSLDTPPSGATIDPATGVFTWTPSEGQGPGQYTITVRAKESGAAALSTTTSFKVTVNEVNSVPTVQLPAPLTRPEMTLITVQPTIVDADILNGQTPNTNRFTFTMQNAPDGATINPQTGAFSWTPTEAQGPATYQINIIATDDGVPPLSGSATLTINVTEANRAPSIVAPPTQSIPELTPFSATFTASDPDLPTNNLSFFLVQAPAGVKLDALTGVLTWTPTEAQGPGNYAIKVGVSDNGSPALFATNTLNLSVTEVNTKPALSSIPDFVLPINVPLNFTATATDTDIPAQTLAFSLDSAPQGATIDPVTGVFKWTPTTAQGGQQYTIVMRATESGAAALFDTKSFKISVTGVANTAPMILSPANQTVAVGSTLTVTNVATDSDIPINTLTFSIVSGPAGATINATSGILTWAPTSSQVGTTQIQVRVTDNGVPPLSATNSFSVTVTGGGGSPATLHIDSVLVGGTTLRVDGPSGSSYEIQFSTDLINWTSLTTVSLGGLTTATYLDTAHGFGQPKGFYRAKSTGGGTASAPTLLPTTIGSNGLTLRVSGDNGVSYRVLFSTDLLNWTPIGSISITTGGSADFVDAAQPTRGTKGFYRATFP